jgi:trimeric autotransporter adhesin
MRNLLFLLVVLLSLNVHAQVAINTDASAPDNSAMLDVKSTTRGMLVPRMTTLQRTSIASPATGLLVFDNTTNSFWFYNGILWSNLSASGGSGWLLSGNSGTIATTNFIGTTDNIPLSFKVNNNRTGLLSNDNVLFGRDAGITTTSAGIIAIGRGALAKNTDRVAITAIGDSALYYNGTGASGALNGNYNTAVGTKALKNNSTGYDNVSVGDYSLFKNASGFDNTAMGSNALGSNLTGFQNTAAGSAALTFNQTGNNNTAVGFAASRGGLSGSNNTALGFFSLFSNTSGYSNVAIGAMALRNQTNINNTVSVGDSSLFHNSATQNTAIGSKALYSNTTGAGNTANGYKALFFNTTGIYNTANGNQALNFSTTGSNNTAEGNGSLYANSTGSSNTANGSNSLYSNTSGNSNTANGYGSLFSNLTGNNNTATGESSMFSNTTGYSNAANGYKALYSNTTGFFNTSNGNQSLYLNTIGSANTASGNGSLYSNQTGFSNTASGYNSLYSNQSGNRNTATGYGTLYSNTTGDHNIATGFNSMYFNTTGSGNIAIGFNALTSNTTGNNIVAIGNAADAGQAGLTNASAIGANARVDASNSIVLGSVNSINSATSNVNVGIGTTSPAAALDVRRDPNNNGALYATAYFAGTTNISHFNFGPNEDTYLRGGKTASNVMINDLGTGRVGIGMSNPTRAGLEQYGVVGNTAAIFGGEGAGVSLQRDWPAIGLNHWYDGSNSRSIGFGYGAQIGVNQNIGIGGGAVYVTNFSPRSNAINGLLNNPITRVFFQNGRIGVGTNDPQSDIDIYQTGSSSEGLSFTFLDHYSAYTTWKISGASTLNSFFGGAAYHDYLQFIFNNNLAVGISEVGEYYQASDQRLKKNIEFLADKNMLSKLVQLKPATYDFITEKSESGKHYGFLSQDVEKIFPEFVMESKEGTKLLNYQGFIPVLTKAIQEQQITIEDLKTQNEQLIKRIEKLENK